MLQSYFSTSSRSVFLFQVIFFFFFCNPSLCDHLKFLILGWSLQLLISSLGVSCGSCLFSRPLQSSSVVFRAACLWMLQLFWSSWSSHSWFGPLYFRHHFSFCVSITLTRVSSLLVLERTFWAIVLLFILTTLTSWSYRLFVHSNIFFL